MITGGLNETFGDRRDENARVHKHWKGLKDRGVAMIHLEPLRLFYLHDLLYWRSLYSEE